VTIRAKYLYFAILSNRVVAYGTTISGLHESFAKKEEGFKDSYITFFRRFEKNTTFEIPIGDNVYHFHSLLVENPGPKQKP
jgi:hypothetical protein